ncbi:GNAT family N-acetyltransferase [Leptolyngbya boryana CZ1]|uniref:GNAT family N-acetyltransferase n=1 Tax=Leptolyngbya boryana CZ1 TaxID=3060204 RepID=A0AA96WT24_LEPBY|nr:GNAT family N-acetyltransferase [Leptolyngbya boryana]WNZ45132.1 GNAT family N-acetyltransferase [Leptolyngbya boryana CZ1]
MLTHAPVETPRLSLRFLSLADAPSLQTAASDREVADMMISLPHPYPEGEAERYIQAQIAASEAGRSFAFAIERKAEPGLCGVIEIGSIELEHARAELRFWLAVAFGEQGYMSEALQAILRFGFENLNLNRIDAYHLVRNPASGKLFQDNGFVQEGVLRQRVRKGEVFEDVKLWSILREDW